MPAYLLDLDVLAGQAFALGPDPVHPPEGAIPPGDPPFFATHAEGADRTPAAFDGYLIESWWADYWDRINITIDNPALGTVAGTTSRTLTIWNTYQVPKTVSAQTAPAGLVGIAILDLPGLPFDLAAQEERSWTIEAGATGPALISGAWTFTIGAADIDAPALTGRRSVIFAFPPEWSAQVTLRRRYPDALAAALDLAEDRHGQADGPQLAQDWRILPLSAAENASLRAALERMRAIPAACPIWPEFVTLTAAVAAGATVLPVSTTTGRKFGTAGANIMLWSAWDSWEIATLDTLAGAQIDTADPLEADWPAGTLVLPVLFGRIAQAEPSQIETDRLAPWQARFEELPL